MKIGSVICIFFVICLVETGCSQDTALLRQWIYGKFNTVDDIGKNRSPNIEIDSNKGTYYKLNPQEMSNPVSLREFNYLFIPFYRQKFGHLKNNLNYEYYKRRRVTPYPKYKKNKLVPGNLAELRRKAEKYLFENFVFTKPDTTTKPFKWESFHQGAITDKLYIDYDELLSTIPAQWPTESTTENNIINFNNGYDHVVKKVLNAFNNDVSFAEPSNIINISTASNDESKQKNTIEDTKMSEIVENTKHISSSSEEYVLNKDSLHGNSEQLKSSEDKDSLLEKLNYDAASNIVEEAENTRSEDHTISEKSSEMYHVSSIPEVYTLNNDSSYGKAEQFKTINGNDSLHDKLNYDVASKTVTEADNTSNEEFTNSETSFETYYVSTEMIDSKKPTVKYEFSDNSDSDDLVEYITKSFIDKSSGENNDTSFKNKSKTLIEEKAVGKANEYIDLRNDIINEKSYEKKDYITTDVTIETSTENFTPVINKLFPNLTHKTFNELNTSNEFEKIFFDINDASVESTEMYKSNDEKNKFEDTTSPAFDSSETLTTRTNEENNENEQGKNIQLTQKYEETSNLPTQNDNYTETDFGSTTNPTEVYVNFFTVPYSFSYSPVSESDNVISETTTYGSLNLGKDLSNDESNNEKNKFEDTTSPAFGLSETLTTSTNEENNENEQGKNIQPTQKYEESSNLPTQKDNYIETDFGSTTNPTEINVNSFTVPYSFSYSPESESDNVISETTTYGPLYLGKDLSNNDEKNKFKDTTSPAFGLSETLTTSTNEENNENEQGKNIQLTQKYEESSNLPTQKDNYIETDFGSTKNPTEINVNLFTVPYSFSNSPESESDNVISETTTYGPLYLGKDLSNNDEKNKFEDTTSPAFGSSDTLTTRKNEERTQSQDSTSPEFRSSETLTARINEEKNEYEQGKNIQLTHKYEETSNLPTQNDNYTETDFGSTTNPTEINVNLFTVPYSFSYSPESESDNVISETTTYGPLYLGKDLSNNDEKNKFKDTTSPAFGLSETLTTSTNEENNENEQGKNIQLTQKYEESSNLPTQKDNYIETDFGSTTNPTEINVNLFTVPYSFSYSPESESDNVISGTTTYGPLYLGKDLSNNDEKNKFEDTTSPAFGSSNTLTTRKNEERTQSQDSTSPEFRSSETLTARINEEKNEYEQGKNIQLTQKYEETSNLPTQKDNYIETDFGSTTNPTEVYVNLFTVPYSFSYSPVSESDNVISETTTYGSLYLGKDLSNDESNNEKNKFENTTSQAFGLSDTLTTSTNEENNENEQGKNIQPTQKYEETSNLPTQKDNYIETDFGSTTNPTEVYVNLFTVPYSFSYSPVSESDNVISETTTYEPLYLGKDLSNNDESNDEKNQFVDTTSLAFGSSETLTTRKNEERTQSQDSTSPEFRSSETLTARTNEENNEYEQGKNIQLTQKYEETANLPTQKDNYIETDFGSPTNPTEVYVNLFTVPYSFSYSPELESDKVISETTTFRALGKDLSNNNENMNSNDDSKATERYLSLTGDISAGVEKLLGKDSEMDISTNNVPRSQFPFHEYEMSPKEITNIQESTEFFGEIMRNEEIIDEFVTENIQVTKPYYASIAPTNEEKELYKIIEDADDPSQVKGHSKDYIDTLKPTFKNDETEQHENSYDWTTSNSQLKNYADYFTEPPQNSQETSTEFVEVLQNKNKSLEYIQSETEMKNFVSPFIAEVVREESKRYDNVEKDEAIEEFSNFSDSNSNLLNEALTIDITTRKDSDDGSFATERNYIATPIIKEINSLSNEEKVLKESDQFYDSVAKQELTEDNNEDIETFMEKRAKEMSYFIENNYDSTTSSTTYIVRDSQNSPGTTELHVDQQNEYINPENIQLGAEMKNLLSPNVYEKKIDDIVENDKLIKKHPLTDLNNDDSPKFVTEETLHETTSYHTDSSFGETKSNSLSKHDTDSFTEEQQKTLEITTEFIAHQQNKKTQEYIQTATEIESLLSPDENLDSNLENGETFGDNSSFKELNTDLENKTHTAKMAIGKNESPVIETNFTELLRTLNMEISFETTPSPPLEINSFSKSEQNDTQIDQLYKIDEEQRLSDINKKDNATFDEERVDETPAYYIESSDNSTTIKSLLKHYTDSFIEDSQNPQETTTNFVDVRKKENLSLGYVQSATEMKSLLPPYLSEIVSNGTENHSEEKGESFEKSLDGKELNSDFKNEAYTTVETTTREDTESSDNEVNYIDLLRTLNLENAIETTPTVLLSENKQFYNENEPLYDINNEQKSSDEDIKNLSEERSHNTFYETTTLSLSPNQLSPSIVINVSTDSNSQKASTESNIEYSTTVLDNAFFRTEKPVTLDQIKAISNEKVQGYIHNTIESLKSITASLLTDLSNNRIGKNENVANTSKINETVQSDVKISNGPMLSALDNDKGATEEISVSENRMPKKFDLGKHKMNSLFNEAKEDREIQRGKNINFHRRSDITPEEDSEYGDML